MHPTNWIAHNATKRLCALRTAVILVTLTLAMRAQESSPPVLTLDQAIQQAVTNNSALKTASLEALRAADDLAANRTKRFASTQITAIGGQLLTKPSVTFAQGSLGVYPATGPIPATDQKIEIPRKPTGAVFASISQPLSTIPDPFATDSAFVWIASYAPRTGKNAFGGHRSRSARLLRRCAGAERVGES